MANNSLTKELPKDVKGKKPKSSVKPKDDWVDVPVSDGADDWQDVPVNASEKRASLARQSLDTLNAAAMGAIDTPFFGAGTAIAKKVEGAVGGDPKYFDELQKNPAYMAGSIGGAFLGGPAGKVLGLAERGITGLSRLPAKYLPGAVNYAEKVVGPLGQYGEYARKGIGGLSEALGFAAKVPATAATQAAITTGARSAMDGNFSGKDISESANQALDPMNLSINYGLQGLGALSRATDAGKRIYAASSPIDPRDVRRAEGKGYDLYQEAINNRIRGTYGQQRERAKSLMTDVAKKRKDVIQAAEAGGKAPSVRRQSITDPAFEQAQEALEAGGSPNLIEDMFRTGVRIEKTLPKRMSPMDLENALVRQKSYIRQRKGELGAGGVYDPRSASPSDLGVRRGIISRGLEAQQMQLDAASPGAGKYFRGLGKNYGVGADASRAAEDAMYKEFGSLRSAGSALGTQLGSRIDYLSKQGLSPQQIMTIINEISRNNQEEGAQ